MEPTDPTEKLEYWREHVRQAALFDGTRGEYSRQNGISAAKLSYYKGQFKPKTSFAKVMPKEPIPATLPAPSTNLSVAVEKVKLPDAKWLANFLKEFLR